MKKELIISLALASSIFAYDIDSSAGWNLKGATNTLFLSSITSSSCVKKVWLYRDGAWLDESKASLIFQGEGYWIQNSSSCKIEATSFEEVVNRYISSGVKSFVISIGEGEKVVSLGDGMSGETKTMIGSVSKGIFGLLAATLANKGELSLVEPISTYLKDSSRVDISKIANAQESSATIANMLNHTAAIFDYVNHSDSYSNDFSADKEKIFSDEISIKYAYNETPNSKIGEYSYSNGGYDLSGLAIEEKIGKDLKELMSEYVSAPLGLKNTFYAKSQTSGVVAGKGDINGDGVLDDVSEWKNLDEGSASGGMVSSTNDLVKYVVAAGAGVGISKELHDILEKHSADDGSGVKYRLGLAYNPEDGSYSHAGEIDGYTTEVIGWRDSTLGVASNCTYTDGENQKKVEEAFKEIVGILTKNR